MVEIDEHGLLPGIIVSALRFFAESPVLHPQAATGRLGAAVATPWFDPILPFRIGDPLSIQIGFFSTMCHASCPSRRVEGRENPRHTLALCEGSWLESSLLSTSAGNVAAPLKRRQLLESFTNLREVLVQDLCDLVCLTL
jgi:hypothetical protein